MTDSPLPIIYMVNIDATDSKLAQQARAVQGKWVTVVSKFTGEDMALPLPLLPETLLLQDISKIKENHLYLGKKSWLHPLTDTCLTSECHICIRAASRSPIYLEDLKMADIKPLGISMSTKPETSKTTLEDDLHALGVLTSAIGNPDGIRTPMQGVTGHQGVTGFNRKGGEAVLIGGCGGSSGSGGDVIIQGGRGGSISGDISGGDGTREMFYDASKGILKVTEQEKIAKLALKREKLKLKQHLHADKCMLEEKKQLSRERIATQCSKYDMLSTLIRWAATAATFGSCLYFLS